jgi:hypothetical protein
MAGVKMHQTTIRFTLPIWEQVEAEARREGISAAQYVRDATLTNLAYGAWARGRHRDPAAMPTARVVGAVPEGSDARPAGRRRNSRAQAQATRPASTPMRNRRPTAITDMGSR